MGGASSRRVASPPGAYRWGEGDGLSRPGPILMQRHRGPWNRPCPAEDRQSSPIAIRGVEQARCRILEHFPYMPVGMLVHCARVSAAAGTRARISGGEIVANFPRRVGVRDIPGVETLIVPRLVDEAGRSVVEPRKMAGLDRAGTDELPRLVVVVVINRRDPVIGDELRVREIGNIDDPGDARGAIEDLVVHDD